MALVKIHFPAGNPTDVEQVVDQSRQMSRLPLDDGVRWTQWRRRLQLEKFERGENRGQRIPQFVSQHRKEFILRATRHFPGVLNTCRPQTGCSQRRGSAQARGLCRKWERGIERAKPDATVLGGVPHAQTHHPERTEGRGLHRRL